MCSSNDNKFYQYATCILGCTKVAILEFNDSVNEWKFNWNSISDRNDAIIFPNVALNNQRYPITIFLALFGLLHFSVHHLFAGHRAATHKKIRGQKKRLWFLDRFIWNYPISGSVWYFTVRDFEFIEYSWHIQATATATHKRYSLKSVPTKTYANLVLLVCKI